jgi:uncharacterized protein (DUF4213/DUF364 family)
LAINAIGAKMEILQSIINEIRVDAPVREIRRGIHWTAVVSRHCGLSSTMIRDHCCDDDGESDFQSSLSRLTALEIARYALSDNVAMASLGLAAINSLTDVDVAKCVEINAAELLAGKGKKKNISVIGHFPFVDDLRMAARNLWVMELHPRPEDRVARDAERFLPQSDIVAISGTTLTNHTLLGLLQLCSGTSMKMLLGPTTPMTEVLFDYGLDVISGSRVTDEAAVLRQIGEGANFRQLKRGGGITLLSMVRDKRLLRE